MRAALIPILFPRRLTGGLALLGGAGTGFPAEPQGLGIDFTTVDGLASVAVKDTTTPGNNLSNAPADSFLTQSGTSPKLVLWSDGLYRWSPHNLFVNSTSSPATQNVTLITGATYTYGVTGSGSLAGTVGASGTASAGSPVTFVATGTSGTFTVTGSLTTMQINRGSTLTTPYHATGAAAWFGVPIEYGGGFYGLSETVATNPFTGAEDATDGAWSKENVTATGNTTVGPDGAQTADTITEDTTTAVHNVYRSLAVTANVNYTLSRILKAGTRRYAALGWSDGTNGAYAVFDLQLGVVSSSAAIASGTLVGSTIAAVGGNGYYRVTLTAKVNNTAMYAVLSLANAGSYTPDAFGRQSYLGTSATIFVGLAQLDLGNVATSLIPVFSTAVTRAVDNINAATTTFPFSATAGLLVVGGRTAKGGGLDQTLWSFDDGTANERIRVYRPTADGHLHVQVTDGGVDQADIDLGVLADDTDFTAGLSWAANSIKASLNGGAVTTDATASLPTMTTLHTGRAGTAGSEWNGRIRKGMYAPRVPASDAELQTLQTRVVA